LGGIASKEKFPPKKIPLGAHMYAPILCGRETVDVIYICGGKFVSVKGAATVDEQVDWLDAYVREKKK